MDNKTEIWRGEVMIRGFLRDLPAQHTLSRINRLSQNLIATGRNVARLQSFRNKQEPKKDQVEFQQGKREIQSSGREGLAKDQAASCGSGSVVECPPWI